jgi:hypothetical protein
MQKVWCHRYDNWSVIAKHSDLAENVIAECYRISATYSGPEGEGLLVQLPRFDTLWIVSEADIKSTCKGIKPT